MLTISHMLQIIWSKFSFDTYTPQHRPIKPFQFVPCGCGVFVRERESDGKGMRERITKRNEQRDVNCIDRKMVQWRNWNIVLKFIECVCASVKIESCKSKMVMHMMMMVGNVRCIFIFIRNDEHTPSNQDAQRKWLMVLIPYHHRRRHRFCFAKIRARARSHTIIVHFNFGSVNFQPVKMGIIRSTLKFIPF